MLARLATLVVLSTQLQSGLGDSPSPLLPGAPLQSALQAAAENKVPTFTIPPGEYNFSSSPLQLIGAASLDIVAADVTFWFSPGGGLALTDCTDVSIRGGLAIDYTPTLAQGVVLSVDRRSEAASFTARFDPAFLVPCPAAASSACKVGLYNPATRLLVRNETAPAAVNIYTPRVEPVEAGQTEDGSVYRVFVRGQGCAAMPFLSTELQSCGVWCGVVW